MRSASAGLTDAKTKWLAGQVESSGGLGFLYSTLLAFAGIPASDQDRTGQTIWQALIRWFGPILMRPLGDSSVQPTATPGARLA